jgi:hypothetical protein
MGDKSLASFALTLIGDPPLTKLIGVGGVLFPCGEKPRQVLSRNFLFDLENDGIVRVLGLGK